MLVTVIDCAAAVLLRAVVGKVRAVVLNCKTAGKLLVSISKTEEGEMCELLPSE